MMIMVKVEGEGKGSDVGRGRGKERTIQNDKMTENNKIGSEWFKTHDGSGGNVDGGGGGDDGGGHLLVLLLYYSMSVITVDFTESDRPSPHQ